MRTLIRTSMIIGTVALLAACNGNGADAGTSTATAASSADRTAYERADDHAIGSVDAPVTITEYASVTCGACVSWHRNVYPTLKKDYIDTGKVRYVFREFLTGNPQLAETGFMIALCAPEEDYFKNIGLQFDRFEQISQMAAQRQSRAAYVNIAKSAGLTEDEFVSCVTDQTNRDLIQSKMQQGFDEGVKGTPAFFANGNPVNIGSVDALEEVMSDFFGEASDG